MMLRIVIIINVYVNKKQILDELKIKKYEL